MGGFGLLILVLIIMMAVWFARATSSPQVPESLTGRHAAGLDHLDQRYARGEITRDEYLQKRADVRG